MNNKVVLGQYYNTDSWIHRLDPRTKIITIILLISSLFLLQNILSLSIALVVTLLIIITSRIPIMKFLNSLKMMTMLLFFTVFFQVVFNKGTDFTQFYFSLTIVNLVIIIGLILFFFLSKKFIRKFRFLLFLLLLFSIFYVQTKFISGYVITNYSLKLYESGLFNSITIVLRIITLIFISSLLTLSTKPTDLNNGLEAVAKPLKLVGVKVSILSMMISISLRFIPTLINEASKILKAQASRGVDFKESKFKEKITQIISLLVPMFVISYKRAYDLADAMEARGYIPEGKRTSINQLKFKFMDVLTFILTFGVLISLIAIKVTNYYEI